MPLKDTAAKARKGINNARFSGTIRGAIGWDQGDGTVLLTSSDLRRNEVFITPFDDPRQPISALCLHIKKEIGLPVLVQKNIDDRWEVIDIDNEPAIDKFGDAAPTYTAPDRVGEAVKEVVPGKNVMPGRCRPLDGTSMFVYVEPFHFDDNYWPGGALDLTSFRPATSNTKAWVVVGLTVSTNTLTAFTGTEFSLAFTMTEDLIVSISITSGVIPLWAWVLTNAQTTITPQTQNADVRYWLSPAGGGTTDADAIHDNVAGEIAAITEKTITANADLLIIEDSAAANAKKRVKAENFRGRINSLTLISW